MKRKIILSLLAVSCASTLALGLAACGGSGAKDDESDYTPPNYTPPNDTETELFTFEMNDDESGYIVTGLADGVEDKSITIPAVYNGLPVTTIGERAFGSCENLTGVTISSGISIIESGAFTGCINLPTFKFPSSITVIGDSAFQNCTGLRAIYFADGKLEEIASNAFQNCSKLASASIPDSVVTLGDRVFQNCSSLKTVTLGDGIETIGEEAFRGCTNLEEVTIGNSLKSIAEKAFLNCTKITELVLPDTLESVGLGALEGCTGIKKLTIPFVGSEKYDEPPPDPTNEEEYSKNHTNFGYIFGANSFSDNYKLDLDNLETVIITGDSPIGYHAFQGIGRYEGSTAIGLSTIIITGDVKIFSTGAFQSCYNLQTLVIPKSVTKIGGQAVGATQIDHIYYCGSEDEWSKIADGGWSNNWDLYGTDANGTLIRDPRYFYSENEPTGDGQYWHYVDGVPTPWDK